MPAASCNVRTLLEAMRPALNGSDWTDIVFWTETEIFEYADKELIRLAKQAGLFVIRNSVVVSSGTAQYALPTRHLSTVHASLGTAPLRPIGIQELESLDSEWTSTEATPKRYTQDQQGSQIRLYPKPIASGTLWLIHHQRLAAIDTSSHTIQTPHVIGDALAWSALAAARGRESEGRMQEVADHARQRAALYDEIFADYWGESL